MNFILKSNSKMYANEILYTMILNNHIVLNYYVIILLKNEIQLFIVIYFFLAS